MRPRHVRPRWLGRARAELADLLLNIRQAVLAGLAGMMLLAVVPVVLGWTTTVVVSGSMMPRIRPGDVVAAAPAGDTARKPVARGTVVLVDNPVHPGTLLLHRLVDYNADGSLVTKGDANAARDSTPVPVRNLRGIARLKVPYVGLPYLWFQQGRYVPVVATVVLLLALVLWRPSSHRAAHHPAPATPQHVAGRPALSWRVQPHRRGDPAGSLVLVAAPDGKATAAGD